MKVGDLVKVRTWRDFYQIMKIYRNEHGGLRLNILCLTTGRRMHSIRPCNVKVLS